MAIVVFGQGVASIRGRIGGTVFSANQSGAYARTINQPGFKRTLRRTNNLPDINTLTQEWFFLDPADRGAWNDFAAAHTWSNSFGVVSHPSGLNLFIDINFNRINLEQSIFSTPPSYNSTPTMVSGIITIVNDQWVVGRDVNYANTDLVTVVSVTPPMSIGSLYIKNKIRKLVTLSHPQSEFTPIQTELNNYFGTTFPLAATDPPFTFAVGIHSYNIRISTGISGVGFSYVFPGP